MAAPDVASPGSDTPATKPLQTLAVKGLRDMVPVSAWKSRLLRALCQFRSERKLRSKRRVLERMEQYIGKSLSFAGQQE